MTLDKLLIINFPFLTPLTPLTALTPLLPINKHINNNFNKFLFPFAMEGTFKNALELVDGFWGGLW